MVDEVEFGPLMQFADDPARDVPARDDNKWRWPTGVRPAAACRIEPDENGMKIRQGVFCEPRFREFAVIVRVGNDGPDLMFSQRLVNGPPGIPGSEVWQGKQE